MIPARSDAPSDGLRSMTVIQCLQSMHLDEDNEESEDDEVAVIAQSRNRIYNRNDLFTDSGRFFFFFYFSFDMCG